MEQPATPNPDPARTLRWERHIVAELARFGVDPNLLMPDEFEALLVLRERADSAYGAYLDAEDAARKALRLKDYAQSDYERCLQHTVRTINCTEQVARNTKLSEAEDSR